MFRLPSHWLIRPPTPTSDSLESDYESESSSTFYSSTSDLDMQAIPEDDEGGGQPATGGGSTTDATQAGQGKTTRRSKLSFNGG